MIDLPAAPCVKNSTVFPLFVSHWWPLTTSLTNRATVNCTHGKAIKGVESLSKWENCLLFSGLFEENRAHLQTLVFPQVVSSGDKVVKFRQTPAALEISNELLMCDKAADAPPLMRRSKYYHAVKHRVSFYHLAERCSAVQQQVQGEWTISVIKYNFHFKSCLHPKLRRELCGGARGLQGHGKGLDDCNGIPLLKCMSSYVVWPLKLSMIVEDTNRSPPLSKFIFTHAGVRCLCFLPALSLFVLLLSVNMKQRGILLLRRVPGADVTAAQQLSRSPAVSIGAGVRTQTSRLCSPSRS